MFENLQLFIVKEDARSQEAIELLRRELPDAKLRVVICPPMVKEGFVLPFIKVGKTPYYGLLGIRSFIENVKDQKAVA